MKAPAVDYVRPRSLTEAIDQLARAAGEARVIAGGQSLVAMMNLRIASPGLLIDIARLAELGAVADDGLTKLELDLSELESAPPEFRSR